MQVISSKQQIICNKKGRPPISYLHPPHTHTHQEERGLQLASIRAPVGSLQGRYVPFPPPFPRRWLSGSSCPAAAALRPPELRLRHRALEAGKSAALDAGGPRRLSPAGGAAEAAPTSAAGGRGGWHACAAPPAAGAGGHGGAAGAREPDLPGPLPPGRAGGLRPRARHRPLAAALPPPLLRACQPGAGAEHQPRRGGEGSSCQRRRACPAPSPSAASPLRFGGRIPGTAGGAASRQRLVPGGRRGLLPAPSERRGSSGRGAGGRAGSRVGAARGLCTYWGGSCRPRCIASGSEFLLVRHGGVLVITI